MSQISLTRKRYALSQSDSLVSHHCFLHSLANVPTSQINITVGLSLIRPSQYVQCKFKIDLNFQLSPFSILFISSSFSLCLSRQPQSKRSLFTAYHRKYFVKRRTRHRRPPNSCRLRNGSRLVLRVL